jgi:hypothetical protein
MTSIASIISFFVLLLITYSYSIPVEKVHDSSTVHYEFTTDKTMVDYENTSPMPSIPGKQSTVTPNMHKKRINPVDIPTEQTIEEHHTTEESVHVHDMNRRREPPIQGVRSIDDEESLRTEDVDRRCSSHKQERSVDEDDDEVTTTDVYRPSRTFEETSYPSTTIKSTSDYSLSHEEHDKRSFKDEFSTTTIETSTEFNRRAVGPMIKETPNESYEEVQSTTRELPVNNIETSTNVKPSSSVDSLGKMTRLLHDSSSEESTTTQSSFKTHQMVKNFHPSKTSVVNEPVQQLSQGQKQPVIETKKSN